MSGRKGSVPLSTKLFVRGDLRNRKFYVGEPYVMRVQTIEPQLRSQTAMGQLAAVTSGRMQLRTMTFNFDRTGVFRVNVNAPGRSGKTVVFQPRRATVVGSETPVVTLATGSFRVLTPGEAKSLTIELTNDSFLPCWITGVEWEGFYTSRAQRV